MTCLKHGVFAAAIMLAATMTSLHQAHAQPCEQESFEEAKYVVCTLEPGNADLRLFWKNADGAPYRAFSSLAEAVRAEGRTLTFAVNAGMYRADFSPMGLYVENGRELNPANTTEAESSAGQVPNFYKKPNGVFFLGQAGAGILPTEEFLKRLAKGAVRHPVRPDACHRQQAEPDLHRRLDRPDPPQRCRNLRARLGSFRDQRRRSEFP